MTAFKNKVGSFLYRRSHLIMSALLGIIVFSWLSGSALAIDADEAWSQTINLVATWVTRIGGVVIGIGIIMFGLGWQRDDATGRTAGISTAAGGAIVIAAVQLIRALAA